MSLRIPRISFIYCNSKKKTFKINSKKLTSQALLIRTRLLKRWIALAIHRMNHYPVDKY